MRQRHSRPLHISLMLTLPLCGLTAAYAGIVPDACLTWRMSLDAGGGDSSGMSSMPCLSADGAWVVFESAAPDLVPGDTNGATDVFVRDLQSGLVERVSVASGGGQANGNSYHASISADGSHVIYESDATNLVVGDTNGLRDVFVINRGSGAVTRVSVSSFGNEANATSGAGGAWRGSAISGDGRLAVFQSSADNLVVGDTNFASDIFVRDLITGVTSRASMSSSPGPPVQANGSSQDPAISSDGRYVAYQSSASNLVAGDTNGVADIFRTELATLSTLRVSSSQGAAQANGSSGQPAISATGAYIAFQSFADNLVAGDTNGHIDIFRHNVGAQLTRRVSVTWDGQESGGYHRDPSISADGACVAFTAEGSEMVPNGFGPQSVYIRDVNGGTTERWGEDSAGQTGLLPCGQASISSDGKALAFRSLAALDPLDGNSLHDIYLRECTYTATLYCPGLSGTCPCANGGDGDSGCTNTSGGGALLEATGVPSVFADSVQVTASGMPPTVPALLFQGTDALVGVILGDGLRCVGGATRRLGLRSASGGVATWGVGSGLPLSIRGMVPTSGQTLHYQAWYRDPTATCTSAGYNLSNGLTIHWAP